MAAGDVAYGPYALGLLEKTIKLPPLTRRWLVAGPLVAEAVGDTLSAPGALALWFADLVIMSGVTSREAGRVLVEDVHPAVLAYGTALAAALAARAAEVPVCRLVLSDRRYAAVDGLAGLLDLTTGDRVAAAPGPGLEVLAYSLPTLFVMQDRRYRALAAAQAGGGQ